MSHDRLRIAVQQLAPVLGDVEGNRDRILALARDATPPSTPDLLVLPELALTGYDVGDAATECALRLDPDEVPLPGLDALPATVLGVVELGADGVPYNTAALLEAGRPVFRHRKLYLPTYGPFDEGRFFGRGAEVRPFESGGWRLGLLVCEDLWHPALPYLLALQGVELLVVLAAAPGRGAWQAGESGAWFASADAWERIARTTAQLYGIYVALANRVGAEGGITFAGGSLVVGPNGELLARGPSHGEAVLAAELTRGELQLARRPYAHARDEDPWLTLRELRRILEEGRRG